jgi:xylose isomerase
MLAGGVTLGKITARVEKDGLNPRLRSSQQEYLESIVNRYV